MLLLPVVGYGDGYVCSYFILYGIGERHINPSLSPEKMRRETFVTCCARRTAQIDSTESYLLVHDTPNLHTLQVGNTRSNLLSESVHDQYDTYTCDIYADFLRG